MPFEFGSYLFFAFGEDLHSSSAEYLLLVRQAVVEGVNAGAFSDRCNIVLVAEATF